MEKIFKHVAIVGLGLIGGSLAMTIKKKNMADKITCYGRNLERMNKARKMGLVDQCCVSFNKGLGDADLVVIGTPVRTVSRIVRELTPFLKPGVTVTDVGSVKEEIVHGVEAFMPENFFFIGGHPIAGTENSGFESSIDDLFENRIFVLTPTVDSDRQVLNKLELFWKMTGARVICMDARTHDRIFSAVSHLPHMVAFSLVNALVDMKDFEENILQYSAGGFKDFTRIAASDPVMWRDIALQNRENILRSLDFFENSLSKLKDAISRNDGKRIEELFKTSRDARLGI